MAKRMQSQVLHYPTLKTVMAIEEVIKNSEKAVSRNGILRKLRTSVMRSTLNVALGYLEKRGMVLETRNGYIWSFNPNPGLAIAEQAGLEV